MFELRDAKKKVEGKARISMQDFFKGIHKLFLFCFVLFCLSVCLSVCLFVRSFVCFVGWFLK